MNKLEDARSRVLEEVRQYYNCYNEISLNLHMGYNFAIQQNIEEVIELISFLDGRKFNSFVELGTSMGGTLWLYSRLLCTRKSSIIGIDSIHDRTVSFIVDKLKKSRPNTSFIRGFTSEVESNLSIDLLHIDAGHSYEEVMIDYQSWGSKVINNGIILFHDVILHDGVNRFFQELKLQIDPNAVIITKPPFSCGIGIIKKNG